MLAIGERKKDCKWRGFCGQGESVISSLFLILNVPSVHADIAYMMVFLEVLSRVLPQSGMLHPESVLIQPGWDQGCPVAFLVLNAHTRC